jgi:dephospho-CoA kinase
MSDADITGEMAAIDAASKRTSWPPLVFGLTGGIASGKSTVAKTFAENGVPIIDADVIAREVVQPGTPGLTCIQEAFGSSITTPEGTLDRKKLGAIIFADDGQRYKLDYMLGPFIIEAIRRHRYDLEQKGHSLICLDAPLLVEKKMQDEFRPVVVVTCPRATQVKRLRDRNGFSEIEAEQRLASQLRPEERDKAADYLIHTNGTLEQSKARALEVLTDIRKLREIGFRW